MFEKLILREPMAFAQMRKCIPDPIDAIYSEYVIFLTEIGFGPIGPGYFAISPKLRDFPGDWPVNNKEFAKELRVFGDDLAGSSFGFHPKYGQRVLRYDSANGAISAVAESFYDFLWNELK